MVIGVDFDNTVVCYDGLFHKVALKKGLIPADLPATKHAVREHLRKADDENHWIELQGLVYGEYMQEAEAFPGVLDFFEVVETQGDEIKIISHRTHHPVRGKEFDLHLAARNWLSQYAPDIEAHFLTTRAEKIKAIADTGCEIFIEDLPEVLAEDNFPPNVRPVLFDPNGLYKDLNFPRLQSWFEAADFIEKLLLTWN